jgi:Lrp/AsnC family leucine-responsive transcriptional regulator
MLGRIMGNFYPVFLGFMRISGKSVLHDEEWKKMRLDKFDLAILRVLQDNARASLNEIGAAVGLSSTPCWNRIKRMETAGVIRGYTVNIDPAALGFMDTVIVHVTLESHSEETLYEFGRALAQIPEVLEAFLVSGDYDYYIRIAVRDTRDYERLLREQLYRIPGIRHSKSSFVLRRLKESMLPLMPPAPI